VKAAGALYRMGDDSGLQVLQELTAEPAPNMRLAAADAMASRPDGTWLALVRELTAAPDLEVRASAARLIAPHDPELARSVLESLAANENPAIRELASQGLGEVPSDLTSLRRLMRSPDRLMRIRAAGRVMVVTR
jgi:HEAT repeat protein